MMVRASFVGLAVVAVSFPALAQDCPSIENDSERLACYDQANSQLPEECEIEDWNYAQYTDDSIRISGATTCASGKLNYRLYSDGEFLTSDFMYIEGYSFQGFADIGNAPASLNIRYTISR